MIAPGLRQPGALNRWNSDSLRPSLLAGMTSRSSTNSKSTRGSHSSGTISRPRTIIGDLPHLGIEIVDELGRGVSSDSEAAGSVSDSRSEYSSNSEGPNGHDGCIRTLVGDWRWNVMTTDSHGRRRGRSLTRGPYIPRINLGRKALRSAERTPPVQWTPSNAIYRMPVEYSPGTCNEIGENASGNREMTDPENDRPYRAHLPTFLKDDMYTPADDNWCRGLSPEGGHLQVTDESDSVVSDDALSGKESPSMLEGDWEWWDWGDVSADDADNKPGWMARAVTCPPPY